MSRVLGLSAYHADASAAAVVDGRFVAGVESACAAGARNPS